MAVLNFRKKVKGSTLIETLVAMTVILISLVFCGLIFLNILNSGSNLETFRAHTLLNEVALKTKGEEKFIDETLSDGNIQIQKTVRPFNGVENLYLQSITASNSKGKVLAEYKELMFVPER